MTADNAGSKGSEKNAVAMGKYAQPASSMQWEFAPLQGKFGAVRWTGNCQ